jgi:hypothetical protein
MFLPAAKSLEEEYRKQLTQFRCNQKAGYHLNPPLNKIYVL